MDLLLLSSLFAICCFGVITSYEDIKLGLIRNRWVGAAIVFSIFVTVLSFTLGGTTSTFLFTFFINILFATFVALLIWVCNLWSAGDAKLFIAYAALIPLSFYRDVTVAYFPSFTLLLNTFAPFLIFYLFKILFATSTKLKLKVIKTMCKPKYIFETLLFVFAFAWVGSLVMPLIAEVVPIVSNVFVTILFLFFVLFLFKQVFKIPHRNISIGISIVALMFDWNSIFSIAFVNKLLLLFLLFIVIRHFVLNLAFELFSYRIYIENVKPGMLLAENFVLRNGKYTREKAVPLSFVSSLLDSTEKKMLFKGSPKGMTAADIQKLNYLHGKGDIPEHTVRVFQTVPFAPFMFAGCILTLILQSSVFSFFL